MKEWGKKFGPVAGRFVMERIPALVLFAAFGVAVLCNALGANWNLFIPLTFFLMGVLALLLPASRVSEFLKTPEKVFLVLGAGAGLMALLLIPPFQVADECAHFERAMQLAHGIWYNSPEKLTGERSPSNLVATVAFMQYYNGRPGNPREVMALNKPLSEFEMGYCGHEAAGYSPLMYLAPAGGILLARAANASFFGGFYAGRLFGLLFFLTVVYWAIRITPKFKWLFLFTALLPMSVSLGMSFSADSFSLALAFFTFGWIFRLLYTEKRLHWPDYAVLVLLGVAAGWSKMFFWPFLLLFFVPAERFIEDGESRKSGMMVKFLFSGLLVASILLIGSFWSSVNYMNLRPGWAVDPEMQARLLLTHPFGFLRAVWMTVSRSWWDIFCCYTGVLGWLDTGLDKWFYFSAALVMGLNFLFFPECGIRWNQRLGAFLLAVAVLLSTYALLAITWNVPGAMLLEGFQGRYLLPASGFLFLIFANPLLKNRPGICGWYRIFFFYFLLFMQAEFLKIALNRFWL